MATDGGTARSSNGPALAVLLRAWRERALLTQAQLAERTGLSIRTISRLEAGHLRRPRSGTVRLLAGTLGLSDEERALLTDAVSAEPAPAAPPPPATPAAPAAPAVPAATAVPAGTTIPRQLPADVAGFIGRSHHLQRLDALLANRGEMTAVVVSAIAGTAGVGKTALAIHWAHRVADHFPDGQLYANLHGYAPIPPTSPIQALTQLLYGLGVEAGKVPVEIEAAAGLYRSLLAGKRALVVLDNARGAEQVRPLLPGGCGCTVVITSRDRLTGLVASHGAHRLVLDALTPAEALALLAQIVGEERVAAEPQATVELAELCGHLPLALRIAAANLSARPVLPMAAYVASLRAGDRLAGLEVEGDPQAAVRAALDCSYATLDGHARRLFRLLGLAPGPDAGAPAAAALAGIATEQAERLLGRLADAHLLEERAPGRYAFHDLLRHYARERASQEDGQAETQAATGRLLAWYLHTADAAVGLLYPHTLRLPVPAADGGVAPAGFDRHERARDWLDGERVNLVAAVRHAAEHGPAPMAWLLADTIRAYLGRRRHLADWLAVSQAGLAVATAAGDLRAQAAAHLSLGLARWSMGSSQQAVEHDTTGLELARQAGWTDCQAAILGNLGILLADMGRLEEADDHLARALRLHRQTGRLEGQAINLGNRAIVNRELGRLAQAAEHQAQALAIYRQVGSRSGEAVALHNLGEDNLYLGRLDDAREYLEQAVALYQEIGDRFGEAVGLAGLAAVHRDAGRHDQARESAQTALALTRENGDRVAEADVLNVLGSVHLRLASFDEAIDHHRRALELARQLGARHIEAGALVGLAAAHQHHGSHEQAVDSAQQALALAGKAGYRILQGRAHTVLAAARLARQGCDQAVEHARQAVALHRATGHRLGQARALVVLGRALRHTHDPAAAVPCWQEALALFTDIGAPEAEQVDALLAMPDQAPGGQSRSARTS